MKNFIVNINPYLLSGITALLLGPFALILVLIHQQMRFKSGKTPMLISDECANCVIVVMVASVLWVAIMNWWANGF